MISSIYQVILTSVAVAAIVSGLALLVNGYWERKSRKKESVLKIAFDLAYAKEKRLLEFTLKTGRGGIFPDPIMQMETYYKWLKHLDEYGKLPDEAHEIQEESREKLKN